MFHLVRLIICSPMSCIWHRPLLGMAETNWNCVLDVGKLERTPIGFYYTCKHVCLWEFPSYFKSLWEYDIFREFLNIFVLPSGTISLEWGIHLTGKYTTKHRRNGESSSTPECQRADQVSDAKIWHVSPKLTWVLSKKHQTWSIPKSTGDLSSIPIENYHERAYIQI